MCWKKCNHSFLEKKKKKDQRVKMQYGSHNWHCFAKKKINISAYSSSFLFLHIFVPCVCFCSFHANRKIPNVKIHSYLNQTDGCSKNSNCRFLCYIFSSSSYKYLFKGSRDFLFQSFFVFMLVFRSMFT